MVKSSRKMLFRINIFHGDFCCYVLYSNVEYQDENLNPIIKINVQKQMARFGFGCKFHTILNLIFFHVF